MNRHDEMQLTSSLASLAAVRDFLQRLSGDLSPECWSAEEFTQFELALNEVASNVMRHSFDGAAEHSILLTGDISDEMVAVELRHRGRPFQPRPEQMQLPNQRSEGGRGLFLIGQLADDVQYYSNAAGEQCVRLVKLLVRLERN